MSGVSGMTRSTFPRKSRKCLGLSLQGTAKKSVDGSQ
jgi:hypothetical protein